MGKTIKDGITDKDPAVKRQNAVNLRIFLETSCREPGFNYAAYMELLHKRIFELCQSNDNNSRLSAIILIDELIDLPYQEEERNMRFTYFIKYFLNSANQLSEAVIIERSKTLGHLIRVGSRYLSEFIRLAIEQSVESLKKAKGDKKRYIALLDLTQLAKNAPSQLYPVISNILTLILTALTDNTLYIRLAGAETLRQCLILLQHRENTFRNDVYFDIHHHFESILKDNKPESTHGYLLGIRELILNTGGYFKGRFKSIHDTVYGLIDSKEKYLKDTLINIIPIFAQFIMTYNPGRLSQEEYWTKDCAYLIQCTSDPEERGNALIALGNIAASNPTLFLKKLDNVIDIIKDSLTPKHLRFYYEPALECVSLLSQALKQHFKDYVPSLLESIFVAGLTESLVKTCSKLSDSSKDGYVKVHSRLLQEITTVLSGDNYNSALNASTVVQSDKYYVSESSKYYSSQIILALKTLYTFDFSYTDLSKLIRLTVLPYLDNDDDQMRGQAAITFSKLLSLKESDTKFFNEMIKSLLVITLTDPKAENRSSVLASFQERFYPFLAQSENLSYLLMSLYDENPDVQEHVLDILGGLAHYNPGIITNSIRQFILENMNSLEYISDNDQKMHAIHLIGKSVHVCSSLVESYIEPIFDVLLQMLKKENNSRLKSSLLRTLAMLAGVGDDELFKFKDDIFPIAISCLQKDNDYLYPCLSLLRNYVSCTGYVITPYKEYPELLELLLAQLTSTSTFELQCEVLRTMSVIGSLDPFIHSQNLGQIKKDNPIINHITDISSENDGAILSKSEEKNLCMALDVIINVLNEPTSTGFHDTAISSISQITQNMNTKYISYLSKIIPTLLQVMERPTCDHELRKNILKYLIRLIVSVKQHICSQLPDILAVLHLFWNENIDDILLFIQACFKTFQTEFKLYLSGVLPDMLKTIISDQSKDKIYALKVINCLEEIVPCLENHIVIVVTPLMYIIDTVSDIPRIQEAAIHCLKRICELLDVNKLTPRIVVPLLKALEKPECRIANDIMDIICILMIYKGQEFIVFLSAVNKIVLKQHIYHKRYNELYHKLINGIPLPSLEVTAYMDTPLFPELEIHPKGRLHINFGNIEQVFKMEDNGTKEDWNEWLRRLQFTLIRESPDPSLRSCVSLSTTNAKIVKDLFNGAFASCWHELSQKQRSFFSKGLSDAINKRKIPTDVGQVILNLAEYLEHDEEIVLQSQKDYILPCDINSLGSLSELCHASAKALHYKELEYKNTPGVCLETLIVLNNKLNLPEAALGILRYSETHYLDFIKSNDSWYEKLGRWEDALDSYENKQQNSIIKIELTMGRLRCLSNLGESQRVIKLASDMWEKLSSAGNKEPAAILAAQAALDLSKWDLMQTYMGMLGEIKPEEAYLQAVLAVHNNRFEAAERCIMKSREQYYNTIPSLVAEGYSRAYNELIEIQMLNDLEEILAFKKTFPVINDRAIQKRSHLLAMWKERLEGTVKDISIWDKLLAIRKLLIDPNQDIEIWLKFSSLARKSSRPALVVRTLSALGIEFKDNEEYGKNIEEEINAPFEVRYTYHKFLHDQGMTDVSIDRLTLLCNETNPGQKFETISPVLKVKCRLRLARWELNEYQNNLDHTIIKDIDKLLNDSTQLCPDNCKAYHQLGMFHFTCIEYYQKKYGNDSLRHLTKHLAPAANSFFDAISLSSSTTNSLVLQDLLRLLTLFFSYGSINEMSRSMKDGINNISVDTWLNVIPQLVARIHIENPRIKKQLMALLTILTKAHPQALIYPLTVSASSEIQSRQMTAKEILNSLRRDVPELVKEAEIVSHELIRVAILWMEMWCRGLEDASRAFYEYKDIEGMLKILEPLQTALMKEPETRDESNFKHNYGRVLENSWDIIQRGHAINSNSEIERAWKSYSETFVKLSRSLKNITELELDTVSPQLLNAKDLTLAVPGTYNPEERQNTVCIKKFHRTLTVMTSKQRPRKISIYGSDDVKYVFLLKGNEDLRQDERVMQLFGLVNRLLASTSESSKQNLFVRTYSITPLSDNCGIVTWVAGHDPLHTLIRTFRESKHVNGTPELANIHLIAPEFDNMFPIQKVEAFNFALHETTGEDIRSVLWLRSKNCEEWLQRRVNYTRSMALMSMVGYILGLGDRHPSNIMMSRESGSICHIDFGDCFEVAMHRDKCPEKIPFRLTRMLVNAMEASGIEGTYRSTCEIVMTLLRQNKESLMAILEAFVHDPLINWRLKDTQNLPSHQVDSSLMEDSHLTNANGNISQNPYTGNSNVTSNTEDQLSYRKNSKDESVSQIKREQAVLKNNSVGQLNTQAVAVTQRVQDKLTGRDFYEDESLTVPDQVNRLIIQATDPYNLCQSYIGWCPFF